VANEIGVGVARVVRDLDAEPIGPREFLPLIVKLDLGDDQPAILAVELVHLEGETAHLGLVPGLLDRRLDA